MPLRINLAAQPSAEAGPEPFAPALAAASTEGADGAPTVPAPAPALHMPPLTTAPRPFAPQQEAAIAQVSELREALRTARPELTVRHAEFGPVALRLEAASPDSWRAVLASRDPGFVPAIQTALAERAIIAAAAASAAAPADHAATGQQGGSDQRYGSSPGAGQGASQPYTGQSPNRDEGTTHHPQQRAARTTDMVAALAAEAEAGPGDAQAGGVFA